MNSKANGHNGDSLYVSGKFFEASIEYERMIFHSGDQVNLNYVKYKKALCYKQLKEYNQALEVLQSIYFPTNSDTLFSRVYYQQSLCYCLNQEPTKALRKIDEYLGSCADTVSYRLFLPLKILCLNETLQWKDAQSCFLRYIFMLNLSDEKNVKLKQLVNDLYSEKKLPRIKSVKKAENLSRFIPGSGQIYAGSGGEGMINFLINASILTFSAYQVYYGFYLTGYLAGLGFFNKTYQGGIKRSGILASLRNKQLIINFNSLVNEIIRSNYVPN